jgi:hypothetical protein
MCPTAAAANNSRRRGRRIVTAPDAPEIREQIRSALVSMFGRFLQRLVQDRLKGGERRVSRVRWWRGSGDDRRRNSRRSVAREGLVPGRHLVEHGPYREDVAPVIDPRAGQMFGRAI